MQRHRQHQVDGPLDPVFFIEPGIASEASPLIRRLVGDDPRFLFFETDSPEKNYNYNANDILKDAIRGGMRGAYWDILRRLDGGVWKLSTAGKKAKKTYPDVR